MRALGLIEKHYGPGKPGSDARALLIEHSRMVAEKAIGLASSMDGGRGLDLKLIEESALLHDIGIFLTSARKLGCWGNAPYICHGYLGARLLESEGLEAHAKVCERHVGAGLTADEIRMNGFPMPPREMVPQTMEEKIVCVADKFFTKTGGAAHIERSLDDMRGMVRGYGRASLDRLDLWLAELGLITKEPPPPMSQFPF